MTARVRSRSAFERADRHVRQLLKQDRILRYEAGEALAQMRDGEVWQFGGYTSFSAYLASLEGPTLRTLRRYIAFADAVPREVAMAFDREWVSLALQLVPPDPEGNVVLSRQLLHRLKVEVDRDGERIRIPMEKASADDLAVALTEKLSMLPAPGSLGTSRDQVAQRFGDGVEVRIRRRRRVAGLGIFVPAHQVAAFLKKLR